MTEKLLIIDGSSLLSTSFYATATAYLMAKTDEDKEKARKMIKNYVIGLVVIFAILVACPYLVKGIAALIAG